MEFRLMIYQIRRMAMSNSIGMYRTWNQMLSQWQYVAPYGHHFMHNGVSQGRIIWTNNPDGYYIEKDDDETETEEDSI